MVLFLQIDLINYQIFVKIIKEILVEMPEIIINYFKNNPKVTVDKSTYLKTIY